MKEQTQRAIFWWACITFLVTFWGIIIWKFAPWPQEAPQGVIFETGPEIETEVQAQAPEGENGALPASPGDIVWLDGSGNLSWQPDAGQGVCPPCECQESDIILMWDDTSTTMYQGDLELTFQHPEGGER